jgi:hypothetical protein
METELARQLRDDLVVDWQAPVRQNPPDQARDRIGCAFTGDLSRLIVSFVMASRTISCDLSWIAICWMHALGFNREVCPLLKVVHRRRIQEKR